MGEYLVTVVLPIYNVEKYLNRCIESVVSQTYQNLEIILVDDGSPDNCPAICDHWAGRDKRIRVIHKQNAGLGMARNSGIEMATGDCICFFDSDDYIEPDLVEKCVKAMQETKAQIVVYGYDRLDKNGKVAVSSVPELPNTVMRDEEIRDIVIPCLAGPMIKDGKKYHIVSSAWGAMYSMKIIRENSFRFVSEREIISEDIYSNLIYYQYVNCMAIIPQVLYHYCDNNTQSLTRVFDPRRFERNKHFYSETLRLCDDLRYCEQTKRNLSNQMLSNTIATVKQTVFSSISKSEKKKLIRDILCDDVLAAVLTDYDLRLDNSILRKVLINAVKHKRVNWCYLLIWLKKYVH